MNDEMLQRLEDRELDRKLLRDLSGEKFKQVLRERGCSEEEAETRFQVARKSIGQEAWQQEAELSDGEEGGI